MGLAEAAISHDEFVPPGGLITGESMCYARSVDDDLAPQLQAHLERWRGRGDLGSGSGDSDAAKRGKRRRVLLRLVAATLGRVRRPGH